MPNYPFQPAILDALPEELAELFRALELKLLEEICSRLNIADQLNEVTVQDIRALRAHGIGLEDIKKAIAKTTDTGMDHLEQLLDDVVERNQAYYTELVDLAGVTAPERMVDQEDMWAIYEQTKGTYRNITQSMGFLVRQGRHRVMLPPAKAYQWALDSALLQVQSGAVSYDQAIREAVRELAEGGLKTVSYESEHVDNVDVAVRRATMTGVNQLNQKYREQSMDYLETDLVEVTAHSGARDVDGPNGWENHKKWQGKVYRGKAKPRTSQGRYPDFERVCGYGYVTGIGGANCRHSYWPFIEGVSERTYTDKELENIDPPPVEFEGRRYTAYEATQKQRQIERTIRKQKRLKTAFQEAGLKEDAQAANIRLRRLNEKYRQFSKATGLPEQRERMRMSYVDDASRAEAAKRLAKRAESGIMGPNGSKGIPDVSKISVPTKAASGDVTDEYLRSARPGKGEVVYDAGYDMSLHQAEVRFSGWLHDTFGGDIKLLNEINAQKIKTADYLWNHKLWDLKTATTEKAANSAIRHGLKQIRDNPGGIFLDYRGVNIDLNELASVIKKRLQWRKDTYPVDIMIILDDGVHVWRY